MHMTCFQRLVLMLLLLLLAAAAGGKLVVQYQKKPTKHPRCGATGVLLHGVSFQRSC